MPNASDPFLNGLALPLSHDPQRRMDYTSSRPDLTAAAIQAAENAAITALLQVLKAQTGIDLTTWWANTETVQAANKTFTQAIQTAIQNYTDGPTFIAQCEAAWNTWIVSVTGLTSGQTPSLTHLLNSFFDIDPATGKSAIGFIADLQDSMTQLGAAASGDVANAGGWTWLADIVNSWNQLAGGAHSMAVDNTNTLGIRNNKPISYGLDDTTESNMDFTSATSLLNITSTATKVAFVRCAQTDTKNTIAFTASTTSAPTGFYVLLYKVDFGNSRLDYISTSANLVSQVGSSEAWLFTSAAATAVQPGDVLAVEFQVVGSGSVDVYGQNLTSKPTHPLAQLPGAAAARTGVPTGANTLFTAIVFNNTAIPYVGLEISSPPPPVYPDHVETFTYTRTLVTDAWASHIDVVGVGQGGGGQGETGSTVGRGGSPGVWGGMTLVVGTDIAAGGSITVTVQPNPSNRGTTEPGSGGAFFSDGKAGAATVFTWNDHLGNPQSMTCNAGLGGGLGNSGNLTTYGQSPGNYTFNGYTYTGGANVLIPTDGYAPGSSGPGGQPFQYGFNGGRGQGWIVEHQ